MRRSQRRPALVPAAVPPAPLANRPGTAPLRHRTFRWLWLAAIASNIGTWMQNVALLAFANQLGGAKYVGIVTFAQLGPMLVLSPFGGVLMFVNPIRLRVDPNAVVAFRSPRRS